MDERAPREPMEESTTGKIINLDVRASHLEQAFTAITSTLKGLADKLVEVHQAQLMTNLALTNLDATLARHMTDSNTGQKELEKDILTIKLARSKEEGASGVHSSWSDKVVKPIILAALLALMGFAWAKVSGK